MKMSNREESLRLMAHIKALENQNSSARGQYIQETLKKFEIKSVTQNCHVPRIKNIIVDFSPGLEKKRLIFSAHYDVVKGSLVPMTMLPEYQYFSDYVRIFGLLKPR